MHVSEAWLHLFHPRRSNNHRPRLLHAEGLFLLVAIAIGFVAILTASTRVLSDVTGDILGFATSITAAQVVEQTNVRRESLGLAPLTMNSTLSAAAHAKAADMFSNQYWAHTSPQGKEPWDFIRSSGYTYQAAGENLARDFMGTGDMVDAWMNSPTHRANIVNARYQEIGVAVVNGTLEGTDTTLVVQMFGRPREDQVAEVLPAASTTLPQIIEEEVPAASNVAVVAGEATASPSVLANMQFITGSIRPWPVVSPLQLTKAFLFSILVLLMATLAYDWALMARSNRARVVGNNLAHILFFACIVFLLVSFHSGAIR